MTETKPSSTRGAFIVVEGGDGAGKTTQLDLLESWLRSRDVACERTREPGGTPVGERIRSLVLEHGQGEVDPRTEALLFAASRAAHVVQRIDPALEAGSAVLCDRYVDSSVAYQGVGRGLGAEKIAELNGWATTGLQADLTILLDVDPTVSHQRRAGRDGGPGDRMESADDAFRTRIREAFLSRAAGEPERYLVIDAAQDPDAVHRQIRARVAALLPAGTGLATQEAPDD
ncbi:dTMP kinase [Nesterenkonia sp. HG001]|uniref:dTMP kinase n=1 Tax=Nesterenkonia sp. HG001 TaxID=2983207 RepID=UPI002AC73944|nr:dTMP kinase [Nesterenkonia sp. HG001]MDZ5076815.1 dTMP kinase [Nesterenkonia sp. HG001]